MDIFLLLLLTLVVFTWPLWLLPLVKMIIKKKPAKIGTEVMIVKDIDTEVSRKPIAKETYTWEEKKITRERSIYAKSK